MKMDIDVYDLKLLIKEAVREVIKEEKIEYFIKMLPYVSDDEMQDITTLYGKPEKPETAFREELEI